MKLSSMRKPTADSFSSLVTRVALSLDPVAFWYRMKLSFMRYKINCRSNSFQVGYKSNPSFRIRCLLALIEITTQEATSF